MFAENPDRNLVTYELWKKGKTIDEISLETGIPRSSVGYYVRKFNKLAKKGEPIVVQPIREEQDEMTLALRGLIKNSMHSYVLETIGKDDLDEAIKMLTILKLMKDLRGYLTPTEEENLAVKNMLQIMPTNENAKDDTDVKKDEVTERKRENAGEMLERYLNETSERVRKLEKWKRPSSLF